MEGLSHNKIDNMFKYHKFSDTQVEKSAIVRDTAAHLAHVIIDNTPSGPNQTVAIRKLLECVMTANHAIAIGG